MLFLLKWGKVVEKTGGGSIRTEMAGLKSLGASLLPQMRWAIWYLRIGKRMSESCRTKRTCKGWNSSLSNIAATWKHDCGKQIRAWGDCWSNYYRLGLVFSSLFSFPLYTSAFPSVYSISTGWKMNLFGQTRHMVHVCSLFLEQLERRGTKTEEATDGSR